MIMEIKRTYLFIFIGILLAISVACGFNVSTAKVSEAFTARDVNGVPEAATTFSQDEVFYLLVTLANAPDDTVTKAIWYAVDAEGADPNTELDQAEFKGGGETTFELSNNNLWPVGTYKVELYLNDKLNQTLEFNVKGSQVENNQPASGTASGVTITDAYTVRYKGEDYVKTSVYSQEEVFFCKVELSDYQAGTVVKVTWVAVNAEGVDANFILYEAEATSTGSPEIQFVLENTTKPWPKGEYTVEISLDGEYQGQVDFSVE